MVARQAPQSVEFSRQEYWNGLPFPSPGDLPDPGIKPLSLMSPALAGRLFTTSTTWEAQSFPYSKIKKELPPHQIRGFFLKSRKQQMLGCEEQSTTVHS